MGFFSLYSQNSWMYASGLYHQVWEGRKKMQITREDWPKWVSVFSQWTLHIKILSLLNRDTHTHIRYLDSALQLFAVYMLYKNLKSHYLYVLCMWHSTLCVFFCFSCKRSLQSSRSAWWKVAPWWWGTNLWETRSTFSVWLFFHHRFPRKMLTSFLMKLKDWEMICEWNIKSWSQLMSRGILKNYQ